MGSSDELLVFYSRIDAFGDGLLRIPALRAARTAFPRSRIVYASSGPSTLEKLLRRHLHGLIDDFRTATPLAAVVSEFRPRGGQTMVADFRNLLPKLVAARMKFLGSGADYEANFPGFGLSWPRRRLGFRPEHNAWRFHRIVERLARRPLPFDHRLSAPAAARAEALRLRGADDRPLVLISANGAYRNKRLSLGQVVAIAGGLAEQGYRVIYMITPGEGPSGEQVRSLEPRIEIVGPNGALQGPLLDDVFLALGEMAAAYIGAEGGMGHLMAAVSTPMIIVNGGFNIDRWRPLSNFVEIVEAGPETATGQVEDVPPAVVLAAADRLFAARSRDHR
jgi:ADP-heptose:LPS heptosyltransferase